MVNETTLHRPDLSGGRILGLDTARAVAVVGMVMVHFGPASAPSGDWLEEIYSLSHGRASLLFVVLAGIGMTLMAGEPDRFKWNRAWPVFASRVVILLPLGLALQLLDVNALIILQYYAVFFVLAAPATFLRDRTLLALAAVLSVAGPAVYYLFQRARPEWVVRYDPVTLADPPALILRELFFTGSYPAVVWMAPFLFGMWIGRRSLNAAATRAGLFLAGGLLAAAGLLTSRFSPETGWWALAGSEPHSQMSAWLIGSTGTAVVVLVICLVLADRLGRCLWPLSAMGQLALTIYVGHILLLDAVPRVESTDVTRAFLVVGVFTMGALLLAVAWRRRFQRGPLESLLRVPAYCFAREVAPDRR